MAATIYGFRSLFLLAAIVILFAGRYGSATAATRGYIKYKDPNAAVEERVEDLLTRMTLPEKLGQMCQVDRFNYSIYPTGQEIFTKYMIGEAPYAETQGDSSTLSIAAPGPDTISHTCGSGMKCLVVLVTGRPLVIEPYLGTIDALAVAWLPGTEGQGVADVLFGDHPFTGTLPRTWMKSVSQLPMNVGDKKYDPLFPFGYGIKT